MLNYSVLGDDSIGSILKWKETEQTISAKPDATVTCTFSFQNVSKKRLQIESIKTSCGCTSAKYTSNEIEPGAEGLIEMTSNLAGRKKGISIQAVVQFRNLPSQILSLEITVEGLPRLSTSQLRWDENASKEPKSFTIDFNAAHTSTLESIESSDNFNIVAKYSSEEFLWTVEVTPKTDVQSTGIVTVNSVRGQVKASSFVLLSKIKNANK